MKYANKLALIVLALGVLSGCGALRTALDPAAKAAQAISDKKSVYFDFDSAAVRDKEKPAIKAHVDYMNAKRDAILTLRGSADNGGPRSPDLALANRRAEAIRAALVAAGIDTKRIKITAVVENVAKGGDPTKSRRVDFSYQ